MELRVGLDFAYFLAVLQHRSLDPRDEHNKFSGLTCTVGSTSLLTKSEGETTSTHSGVLAHESLPTALRPGCFRGRVFAWGRGVVVRLVVLRKNFPLPLQFAMGSHAECGSSRVVGKVDQTPQQSAKDGASCSREGACLKIPSTGQEAPR